MIKKQGLYKAKRFCCEDISLIENYEAALTDTSKTKWVCHHKLGIELNKTHKELKAMGLYYNRPACELIFLTEREHKCLHNKHIRKETRDKQSEIKKNYYKSQENREKQSIIQKNVWSSPELRDKLSLRFKGKQKPKYLWQTPDGEIKIMDIPNASRYHPDWVCLGVA